MQSRDNVAVVNINSLYHAYVHNILKYCYWIPKIGDYKRKMQKVNIFLVVGKLRSPAGVVADSDTANSMFAGSSHASDNGR